VGGEVGDRPVGAVAAGAPRQALQLAAEAEIEAWDRLPLDEGERALEQIADWGPAEDWSEWRDAARSDAAG
jgi:hypothetical protein